MSRTIEGTLDGRGVKIALVVSRFNAAVTRQLLAGAEDCLERHGCTADSRTVVWVPGAFELAQAARRLAELRAHDAIVALGALIRGETAHFDVLAAETARGLAEVALGARMPVTFGVLTTDTVEQAWNRAGAKGGNKGSDAAIAALEMVSLFRAIGEGRSER
jgi:6,7-dimethyl-8-ribityllumazine synthase